MYRRDQPDYYNFALSGYTAIRPHDLLRETQRIEAKYGRDRSIEVLKGPRTLDIDILLYDNEILQDNILMLPHPGIRERAFVLLPLLDIDPNLRLPGDDCKLQEYLADCSDQGIYQLPLTII